MKKLILALIAPIVLLSACIGEDPWDGKPQPCDITSKPPEGFFQGTADGGKDIRLLVLENNESWAMYGTQVNNQFYVWGFTHALGQYNAPKYTSSALQNFYFGKLETGSLDATFDGGAVSGTITTPSLKATKFTASGTAGSQCFYNTPATASSAEGKWTGSVSSAGKGAVANLSISPSGAITSDSKDACSFTDSTVTPRRGGKNVYDVVVTATGDKCPISGSKLAGAAVIVTPSNGTIPQLTAMMTNENRDVAGMLILDKQK